MNPVHFSASRTTIFGIICVIVIILALPKYEMLQYFLKVFVKPEDTKHATGNESPFFDHRLHSAVGKNSTCSFGVGPTGPASLRLVTCPREFTKKLDSSGKYLKYYGYSVISMCKEQDKMKKIRSYLEANQVLSRYISWTTADCYHATIFNIFAHKNKPPAQFVKRWLDEEKTRQVSTNSWLPLKDISNIMTEAQNHCDAIGEEMFVNVRAACMGSCAGRGLHVTVDTGKEPWIQLLRQKCSQVFEHDDERLKTLLNFHINFGYLFRDVPNNDVANVSDELQKLVKYLQALGPIELKKPDVMFFDSMERFMPFHDFVTGKIKYSDLI